MTAVAGRDLLPVADGVLGQADTENFPVALRLLPAARREDLLAVYGYARFVDDVGDELEGTPEQRLAALDEVEHELDRTFSGNPGHPVFRRLAVTIDRCRLAREPFAALIEANRMDQRVASYATFDALLGYCRLSADPVGRLVLGVFGESTPERERLSDLVCSGLQVVEHLQDVREDAGRGRVYLPGEDLARFGVDPMILERHLEGAPTPDPVRRLVAFEVTRTRAMLREGAALVGALDRFDAALAVAGFVAGGLAQLDHIERCGYDVLGRQLKAPARAVAAGAARQLWRRWRAR